MSLLNRLLSVPNLVLGAITSGLGLLVLFGVDLSDAQIGGILAFLGAVIALVTAIVVPSGQVIAQQKPGDEPVKATKAAALRWGLREGSTVTVDHAA